MCVANAYRRLAGQPHEEMGRAAAKARLERERWTAEQVAGTSRQAKRRSEPLGVDGGGRRYWAVKSDPTMVFTQVRAFVTTLRGRRVRADRERPSSSAELRWRPGVLGVFRRRRRRAEPA